MVHGSMEIVHEGLLKKSPPPKRLWKAKWRMRWFVLRSGELPGQYFLEYYTDRTCRKLKGKIDLDQCDQVDAGITFANRKADYKYMFDIKTPKRVYYLCAETEQEMNRWVDCVCQVCGLKMYSQEDEFPLPSLEHLQVSPNPLSPTSPVALNVMPQMLPQNHLHLESPPLSPSSISGPYIPISECITGKRTPLTGSSFHFTDDMSSPSTSTLESHRSSIPNEMAPPAPLLCPDNQPPPPPPLPSGVSTGAVPREASDSQRQSRLSGNHTSEDTLSVQSPLGTEGSSVFSDEEWPLTSPKVEAKFFSDTSTRNANEIAREMHHKDGHRDAQEGVLGGHSSGSQISTAITNEIKIGLSEDSHQQNVSAPPRPPKPPHLVEMPQQTYQNIESVVKNNLVRRNSSNDKVKSVTGGMVATNEVGGDPEPSPLSLNSHASPCTPNDLKDDMQLLGRAHQHPESVSPQMIDRSKQRACFNNFTTVPGQNQIFSYDVKVPHEMHDKFGEFDPQISPANPYSNIPQASPVYPPAIDRGLKPRKPGDGAMGSSEMSPPPNSTQDIIGAVGGGNSPIPPTSAPPVVDRNLKPMKNHSDMPLVNSIILDPVPQRYRKHDQRIRAAPSPTSHTLGNGRNNESEDEHERISNPNSRRNSTQDEQIFFSLPSRSQHEIQYTDLDLDLDVHHSPKPLKPVAKNNSAIASKPSVVYKTIDFVKTEVFNEIKKTVEDSYRNNKQTD